MLVICIYDTITDSNIGKIFMNQENRSISSVYTQPMNNSITLKTWSKPDIIELDFVSGTNNSIVIANANDGTQDCQS